VSRRSAEQVRGRTNDRPVFVRTGGCPGELSEVPPADVYRMQPPACDDAVSPAIDEGLEARRKPPLQAAAIKHWLLQTDRCGLCESGRSILNTAREHIYSLFFEEDLGAGASEARGFEKSVHVLLGAMNQLPVEHQVH